MVGAWFRATTLRWSPAISVGVGVSGVCFLPQTPLPMKWRIAKKITSFQSRPGQQNFLRLNVDKALQFQVARLVSPITSATDTDIRDRTTGCKFPCNFLYVEGMLGYLVIY